MARNIEVKARLLDFKAAERTAHEVGGLPQVLRQVDTYFHCTHGRLKLREFEEGAAELIRYQRSDEAGPRCSQYQLWPLVSVEPLKSMLGESLGVKVVVAKTRQLYLAGSVRIHLDEVEGLGAFVEFEDVLTEQEEGDEQRVDALLQRFGIEPTQWVEQSYSDLLLDLADSRGSASPCGRGSP